jgi:hypothetical protein
MKLETFQYTVAAGWSVSAFPSLDSPQTLVIIFAAQEFIEAPRPIHDLAAAYPNSVVIGCSTSGEVLGRQVSDKSLSVAVVRFDSTPLRSADAPVTAPEASFTTGRAIATQLKSPDLRGILVLSDGLQVNGSELVRGLNAELGPEVVVTGGLAGDGDRFKRTWVIRNRQPQVGGATAVGFYGPRVQLGHGSKGGWDIFGPERRVTRSKGNILYELDGKPALTLYKEYLGDRASGLPATGLLFPLALRTEQTASKQLVRTILAIDEVSQSLTFAGDIPEGSLAQLMRANFDRLVGGAADAASLSRAGHNGSATLAVAISCVGRRLVLGERTEEEIEATFEALPPQTQQIGFYSYGELSPFAKGQCDLHNQTMTITTISES